MAASLQALLAGLHTAVRENERSVAAQKAHDIVGDVGHICLQEIRENEVGERTVIAGIRLKRELTR